MPDRTDTWTPTLRSPLQPSLLPSDGEPGGVLVEDLSLVTKIGVRCDDPAAAAKILGTRFGRSVWRGGDQLVVGSGPDEWLLLGPEGKAEMLAEKVRESLADVDALTTVVDLSHGRALVRLGGRDVATVLSRLTAFDFDDRFVPDRAAWRTWVAGVVTDVVRDDVRQQPSYLMHCERSTGCYLADTIVTVGRDVDATLVAGVWPGRSHPQPPTRD